jgi:hypothetical protein
MRADGGAERQNDRAVEPQDLSIQIGLMGRICQTMRLIGPLRRVGPIPQSNPTY